MFTDTFAPARLPDCAPSRNSHAEEQAFLHDLRNILSCASLLVESLAATGGTPGKVANRAMTCIDKAVRLCHGRLLNRTAAGEAPELLPVRDLVEEVLAASSLGPADRITVTVDVDPELLAETERTTLFRIVFNLVTNAVQAMRRTGKDAELVIAAASSGGVLHVDVMDTGPGLPEGYLDALDGRARPDRAPGHGIGLMSSVLLSSRLGGHLQLMRSSAKGAWFRLSVPRWLETGETGPRMAPADCPGLARPAPAPAAGLISASRRTTKAFGMRNVS